MMDPFGSNKFLSLFDVSEQTGEDLATVETWLKSGLKTNQLCGYRAVMQSDLAKFMKSRRKADAMPSAETSNGKPAKPRWHAHGRLTPAQTAEWQGVSLETVEQWIASGLRCETVGSTRLIWRADCKTFLASRKTQSGGDVATERTMSDGSVIIAEQFNHGFFG